MVLMGALVQKDQLVHKDPKVREGNKACRGHLVRLVNREPMVKKVHLDHKENLVYRVKEGNWVLKVLLVK